MDTPATSAESHQTRVVVRDCQRIDSRVLRVHHCQKGNASHEDGTKRVVSARRGSCGDNDHHKARTRYVSGALAEARGVVLGRRGAPHHGVARSVVLAAAAGAGAIKIKASKRKIINI